MRNFLIKARPWMQIAVIGLFVICCFWAPIHTVEANNTTVFKVTFSDSFLDVLANRHTQEIASFFFIGFIPFLLFFIFTSLSIFLNKRIFSIISIVLFSMIFGDQFLFYYFGTTSYYPELKLGFGSILSFLILILQTLSNLVTGTPPNSADAEHARQRKAERLRRKADQIERDA